MRVMAGLSGVSDVEVKTEQVKYMTRRAVGSGSCRIREEIGASGVNTVMASTGEASVREVHIEGANACVSGVLTVSALCMDSSDRLTQTVQHVTFEELIPVDTASAALSARASVDTVVMRPVGAAVLTLVGMGGKLAAGCVFLACYLFGSLVSAVWITNVNVMKLLKSEE